MSKPSKSGEMSGEPGPEAEPEAGPEAGRGRVALRRLGTTTSAVLLLAAAAGAVVAGQYYAPADAAAVPAPLVDVPAGPVTMVCAGPPTQTGGPGMAADPALAQADGTPTTRTELLTLPRGDAPAANAAYTPLGGAAQPLQPAGDSRALRVDATGGAVVQAQPAGETSALVAGATLARTTGGDLRGLSAAACQTPATTTWLVGGATEPGASAQLVLINPGRTPATVNVTAWTSLGVAEAPLLSGIVVAPGAQTAVLLEAALTGDPRLALRVDAAGGEVAATVQDLRLDGFVPAGVDVVAPAAAPALNLTVPGVLLGETELDDPATSAVRLVNPGEEVATVKVRLLGPDGATDLPGAEAVKLDPGAVLDLSLAGIAPGAYAVAIAADRPVTGAVALARTGTPGELDPDVAPVDRAWTPAAEPRTTGILPVPALGELVEAATVTLSNPAEVPVDVELVPTTRSGSRGDPVTVTVPARATVATPAADLGGDVAAVQLGAADGVVAAVVLTAQAPDGELVSVLPAVADPHAERSVRVDVR